MAAIGWFGPLIDLSQAESHLHYDFVQLIVFVYNSQPIKNHNARNRGPILRIHIHVGDDTRPSFFVSLWQKHMGTKIVAGDIVLLQNVKIVKFRDILEAATIQVTSVHILVHSKELIDLKGTDDLLKQCLIGPSTREKLRRVVTWVLNTESAHQHVLHINWHQWCCTKLPEMKNWKDEGKTLHHCLSISELLCLTTSCNAKVYACIDELFLPSAFGRDRIEKDQLSVGKLSMEADEDIIDRLICTGCKLCGSTLDSRSLLEQKRVPLYCQKSSKYLHDVCLIYQPFLLKVTNQAGQIFVIVKNTAAEILFGNITAERVYKCYQEDKKNKLLCHGNDHELHHSHKHSSSGCTSSMCGGRIDGNEHLNCTVQIEGNGNRKKASFYYIWLILLKMLLQKGKNSLFQFEIAVDKEKDLDDGRFELVSLTAPCYNLNTYTKPNLPSM